MQSRVKSDRRRRIFQWGSTFAGSLAIATGSTLLASSFLSPKIFTQPNPLSFTRPEKSEKIDSISFASSPRPISVTQRTIAGVPLYVTIIDLTDPKTFVSVGLANRASQANSAQSTQGDEPFTTMVRHHQAAITANGTFFSTDAQKRVMGNLVSGGKFLKYSPWENYGTTLGLRTGNRPEMTTARVDGKPHWQQHWFSLTAGPRLLKKGEIWLNPKKEGFTDPSVMGVAVRSAIGFPEHGKRLMLVTFLSQVSLKKEAAIMKAIGCYEAMNLDGGTSLGLAQGKKILLPAGRELTNVIAVYDVRHPAPTNLQQSWMEFQQSERAALPKGEG
ncbi:MAG: phosphodiester glycosidase family protein [Leptolyngbyaceae cyanobacterium CSU_1_3]|nr:phosphodiester glycosidase family protein [Leptolyngbyaceae cyanobacterium CSU_1_3]